MVTLQGAPGLNCHLSKNEELQEKSVCFRHLHVGYHVSLTPKLCWNESSVVFVSFKVFCSCDTRKYCKPALKMEPVTEDNSDNVTPWSGSEGSQERCASESIADSNYEDDGSDAEFPLDHMPPGRKSPDSYQTRDWEVEGDQRSLPEDSGSEGGASYREEEEEEDVYLSGSREYDRGSPGAHTPPTSLSPHPADPDSGKRSRPHSSSSSLGCGDAADMTLALTLGADQPPRASNRQFSESLNREGDSSEEGGSNQAPPVSVSFGILDEGAEQAEKWNSESDTVLCRPNSNRARCTRKYLSPYVQPLILQRMSSCWWKN